MIRHNRPLGAPLGTPQPSPQPISQRQDPDDVLPPEPPPPKIQAFEQKFGAKRHEDEWDRTPNVTGTGAIHVRCFHCKLNDDALALLEQSVNEWLDAHPQYEVKFVTTAIGEWQGKTKEQHMVVQVWV